MVLAAGTGCARGDGIERIGNASLHARYFKVLIPESGE